MSLLVGKGASAQDALVDQVSFSRDIRPLLAAKCFACHGPDEEHREAGLRLDRRESAIEMDAIVPGDPQSSELIARIDSDDADIVMPPPESGETLTAAEKKLLSRWIQQDAVYEQHWAFLRPTKPPVPQVGFPLSKQEGVDASDWKKSPIDRFILAQMKARQLQPTAQADESMLLRRVYLDLIGLPPTIEEQDAFFQSNDPDKYEKIVDQLLASPRYGEHWARPWLDLARYSDTNGYEKDRPRSVWPYRDWVIRSLNDDLPYDQFSIEQVAGDMLPNPTADQSIATGFHRNTMLNEEGGVDPLEYRFYSMVDRVATTGTVWMGLTTGCAQCHTHKFDPVTHTDYYRLMALMNNADEPDFSIPDPNILERQRQHDRKLLEMIDQLAQEFPVDGNETPSDEERATTLNTKMDRWLSELEPTLADWQVLRPVKMKSDLPSLELMKDGSIFVSGDITKRDEFELTFDLSSINQPIRSIKIEAIPDPRLPAGGPGRTYYEGRKGDFFLSEFTATVDDDRVEFSRGTDTYHVSEPKKPDAPNLVFDGNGSSGWRPLNHKSERLQLILIPKTEINGSTMTVKILSERHYAATLGRFRISFSDNENSIANGLSESLEKTLRAKPRSEWTEAEQIAVRRAFLLVAPGLKEQRKPVDQFRNKRPNSTQTLVMQERPADQQRPTFRHHRGEYLSPRERVEPGIPELFLADVDPDQQPKNRLEFAQWLVSENNPLAARLAVNRAWRAFFGRGLVATDGDYGVQSSLPTHPKLLDWLAVDLQKDWSAKRLHRMIVTSATYRQTSVVNEQSIDADPDNRWLTRGPRFRLTGETFRDAAMQACGVLSSKMYGPGVRPPQPNSVTRMAWSSPGWNASTGENRFRRSIYTFSKRTAPFAAYTVFDGPSGENCLARRGRSNTPLQALTVLNDEMYLEMTRKLGNRLAKDTMPTEQKIENIFRRFLVRTPTDSQLQPLLSYYQKQSQRLEQGELDAKKIGADSNEAAALAMVARVVMNLNETVTRQ
ncbi:MAG: PSD1 and planctomycete cytochrome C domain-containing protein [Planctomycetota bacterium]